MAFRKQSVYTGAKRKHTFTLSLFITGYRSRSRLFYFILHIHSFISIHFQNLFIMKNKLDIMAADAALKYARKYRKIKLYNRVQTILIRLDYLYKCLCNKVLKEYTFLQFTMAEGREFQVWIIRILKKCFRILQLKEGRISLRELPRVLYWL